VTSHPSAATWHKSSHSGNNGQCVEISEDLVPGARAVRDTKQQGTGPVLVFSSEQWREFVNFVVT
jgi:Domain of unknown function (DUF397)